MESFIVSARKYRPDSFESVVGQEHVTKTLQNEIKGNKLAQAFLFCGPRGVGKTTCARILAKEINKDSIDDPNYDLSFNIFELDAASNNSVEDIRDLTSQVRIPPQVGKYKVYIIDEVHMLSVQAFNAFLKTLEEPPAYAIFILATTEKHKILPTVLSRCQVFNFHRISISDIVDHLQGIAEKEGITAEESALHIIAQKSDGALRDALSMFDQLASFAEDGKLTYETTIEQLNVLDYNYYFKLTDAFLDVDVNNALLIYDEILAAGFDGQIFLNGLASHFRDLMVARDENSVRLLDVPTSIHQKYLDTGKALSDSWLVNAINIANQFDLGYKASSNPRLHVELALIKMCHIRSLVDMAEKKKRRQQHHLKSVFDRAILSESTEPSAPAVQPQAESPSQKEEPVSLNEPEPEEESTPTPEEVTPIEPEAEASPEVTDNQSPGEVGEPERKKKKGRANRLLNVNLNEIKKNQAEGKKDDNSNEKEEIIEVTKTRNEPFSLDEVLEQYGNFSKKMLDEGRKSLHANFQLIKPELDNNVLILKVNRHQRIQFEEIRIDFQQFMRDALKNDGFLVRLEEVAEKTKGRRPYTDREKFEDMAKPNPALEELRKKFGLEFD